MVKRYHHKTIPGVVVEYEVVPNGIFVNYEDYQFLYKALVDAERALNSGEMHQAYRLVTNAMFGLPTPVDAFSEHDK